MLGIAGQDELTAAGIVDVEKTRHWNDTFGFDGVARFVDEDVSEVVGRKRSRDESEEGGGGGGGGEKVQNDGIFNEERFTVPL